MYVKIQKVSQNLVQSAIRFISILQTLAIILILAFFQKSPLKLECHSSNMSAHIQHGESFQEHMKTFKNMQTTTKSPNSLTESVAKCHYCSRRHCKPDEKHEILIMRQAAFHLCDLVFYLHVPAHLCNRLVCTNKRIAYIMMALPVLLHWGQCWSR